jgi:ABC-type transport system involved in multi-copper enzyme maturation permease subunit
MLDRVLAIALNTYRESLRARVLLGLAGVAFAVAFYALIVGTLALSSAPRVMSDLGSASISIFSVVVAVVITATSLHRELEQKTLFPILARPIRRGEYLVGKYLGTLLTIAVFIMADAGLTLLISAGLGAAQGGRPVVGVIRVGLAAVAALGFCMWRWPWARTFGPIPWSALFLAVGVALSSGVPEERRVVLGNSLLAFFEVVIIAAIAMLFSSFSTPFLSAVLTLLMWVIGRSADTLALFPVKFFGQQLHDVARVLSRVLPNLYVYVPARPLLTGEAVGQPLGSYLAMAGLAAAAWALGLLAVASFIFKKRDFL